MSSIKITVFISSMFALMYLVLFFLMWWLEIFFSFPWGIITFLKPTEQTFELEDIYLQVNNKKLHGIFVQWSSDKAIYMFHGNGGPIPIFYERIAYLNSLWYSVFVYDYPGYGKSSGIPTNKNIADFSHAFYHEIVSKKNIPPENITLWGYSIGSAVATQFAYTYPNAYNRLILISPFASRYDVVRDKFGYPWQSLFFRKNTFNTAQTIASISRPLMIIHGDSDTLLPISHSKKIWENTPPNQEKYFLTLQWAWHIFSFADYGEKFQEAIQDFIEEKPLPHQVFSLPPSKEKETTPPPEFDFFSDTSIQKFVSPHHSFLQENYVPPDLVPVAGEFVQANTTQLLRQEAKDATDRLAKDFSRTFGVPLHVVSAYRSYEHQLGIKNRGCADQFCAHAWHSEHQSGLAIDIFSFTDEAQFLANPKYKEYFEWMNANAHLYGFHNSYQNGPESDGYAIEPWHRRYVWIEFATLLYENKINFTQRIQKQSAWKTKENQ